MSENLVEIAKKFVSSGFSVIPVSDRKIPVIPNWGKWQISPMTLEECTAHFKTATNIAVLCGGSSRLFCLDVDAKYDITGQLWNDLKEAIPEEILNKVYIQSTKGGGYHLVFLAPSSRLVGNEKFASRYTTCYEKDVTYRAAFNNPKTRETALKIATTDTSRVLIESRSGSPSVAGGYFLIAPSKGYKPLSGKFGELSEAEYDQLIEISRSFNEVIAEDTTQKMFDSEGWEKTPFEHYREEGDVISVLLNAGWEITQENNMSIRFKRPGDTYSSSSALYDKTTRIFNCFTSSTAFDVSKGYNAVGVFALIECENDFSKAFQKLSQLGYGIKNN